MKIKLSIKHAPGDSPGDWEDSIIRLYLRGDRDTVKKIEEIVKRVITEECKRESR